MCVRVRPRRAARRLLWWAAAAAAMFLVMANMPAWATTAPFTEVMLRELPTTGDLSKEPVTLAQVAEKLRTSPIHQAERLLVYLWEAGPYQQPLVRPVYRSELDLLDETQWDRRLITHITPISIVIVYGRSEEQRQAVYRAIQQFTGGQGRKIRIPTFIATDPAIKNAIGGPDAYIPALFLLTTKPLRVTASRSDDPVSADIWVRQILHPPHPASRDPRDVPRSCEGSWFRRHIARVVRAGIMQVPATGFAPKAKVTDLEFLEWLNRISPQLAVGALPECDPNNPQTITRERAIAGTVRFLWGDDPASELAQCPPPTREATGGEAADYSRLWERAFSRLPGADEVSPRLRPYLVLALAKGLLYQEPTLHPRWPLTREVAAWLLSHALQPGPGTCTGIIVDAIDVPLEQDQWFGRGEIAWKRPDGTVEVLYPPHSINDRLPSIQPAYPVVQYLTHEGLAEPKSAEEKWLVGRVGENPLVVEAVGVGGEWAFARRAMVTPGDALALKSLNQREGLFDDWKVAFLFGRGARLLTPIDKPVAVDASFTVRFNTDMNAATLTPENIWIQTPDRRQRVPVRLAWRAEARELDISPAEPLSADTRYQLVMGEEVRCADGRPLTRRQLRDAPGRAIRCWTFSTVKGAGAAG